MKLTITGDRLALVKRMFTKEWALRSGVKLKSLKTRVVIEGDDSVINHIVKQKKRYFERQELKTVINGDPKTDN